MSHKEKHPPADVPPIPPVPETVTPMPEPSEAAEVSAPPETGAVPQSSSMERLQAAAKAKRRKKRINRLIGLGVTLLILGGLAFGAYKLFGTPMESQNITAMVMTGSIVNGAYGNGQVQASESEALIPRAKGKVVSVDVVVGDIVSPGDLLFVMSDEEIQAEITKLNDEKNVLLSDKAKADQARADHLAKLSVYAPFSGTLRSVASVSVGEQVAAGSELCTIVDDSKLKLVQFFNYAYEGKITVGQTAAVSIPSSMAQVTGTVTAVNYVRKPTAEGGVLFEVQIEIVNPGALMNDVDATAMIAAGDGEMMVADAPAKLQYIRQQKITAEASGKVLAFNLMDYDSIEQGELMLRLADSSTPEEDTFTPKIEELDKKIADQTALLDQLQYHSQITGMVTQCNIAPGDAIIDVTKSVITVANINPAQVVAQISDAYISRLSPGMPVTLRVYGSEYRELQGTILEISMEGKYENGVSNFPVTFEADNSEGVLMSNMSCDYEIILDNLQNILVVSGEAVRYMDDGSTALAIRADAPPENAITPDPSAGLTIPDGFYLVPVTIGAADYMQVQIVDGVTEGTEVYLRTEEVDPLLPTDQNGGRGGVVMVG